MPRIQEYTQQTSVSGEVGGRRASADDLGFGTEMAQFGNTLQSIGVDIRRDTERRELEDASVKMAQSRQQWTETYLGRKQTMQPGDMSMAPTLRTEMNDYFSQMADGYVSDSAKKYVRLHGTTMSTDFFANGLQYQQVQAGSKARADHSVRVDTGSSVAYADPAQYTAIKKALEFDINNGVGAYAYLQNAPDRDKLLSEGVDKIAWSAAMKAAEDPSMRAVLLGRMGAGMKMSDEDLAKQLDSMKKQGLSSQEIADFIKSSRPAADVLIDGVKGKIDATDLPEFVRDLTPQAQQQMVSKMLTYQREEDRVAEAALKQQVDNQMAYVSLTGQVPHDRIPQSSFKGNVAAWETYNSAMKATEVLSGVWSLPQDEGMKAVKALEPKEGDPNYSQKAKVYVEAAKLFDSRWKQLNEDHIGADLQSKFAPGTGGMAAMSVEQPEKWIGELVVRAPQARASSDMRKLKYKILSEDEARVMGQRFSLMDSGEQMKFLSRVGNFFSNDKESIRVLMSQMAQGKQGIAAVGDLMYAMPGSSQNGELRDQTAENILLGTKLLNRPKGGNADDERSAYRQQMPTMKDGLTTLQGMSDFKTMSPEFVARLPQTMEVVMAHYVGKMTKKGTTNFSIKDNESEFKASIKTVLGEPEKIGESRVIVPWGMKNSEFAEAVRQRVPMPWGTYSLRQPVTAPSNIFEVVRGNTIVGAIDINKPVIKREESVTTPTAVRPTSSQLPAQLQGFKTYEERTGKGLYEDSNKELIQMFESNVQTNIEKMTEGLR